MKSLNVKTMIKDGGKYRYHLSLCLVAAIVIVFSSIYLAKSIYVSPPAKTVSTKSTTAALSSNKKVETSTSVPASTTSSATVSSTPPPAPIQSKPVTYIAPRPVPQTPTIKPFSPTALSFIIPAQTTTTSDGFHFLFMYSIARDGSYSSPVSGNGSNTSLIGGPGKSGDYYCGSGSSSNGDNGTATIVVNDSAPNGTYTCLFGVDLANTRFNTSYSIEVTDMEVKILPGATIIPGHQI